MVRSLIVIGTSLGGLHAMQTLFNTLPPGFRVPIIAVQHRSKDSTESLPAFLQEGCRLTVREAEDKDAITPGNVYLAPPDYHVLIDGESIALSTEETVAYSRPSIDLLFESAAEAYGAGVVGVMLTGANQDGTRGLQRIKELGGKVIVQDPATAESRTMPDSVIASMKVDEVLHLEKISAALVVLAAALPRGHA